MTENTNTFAARLRELSRLASAGPWDVWSTYATEESLEKRGYHLAAVCQVDGPMLYRSTEFTAPGPVCDPEVMRANAELTVHLRNHADRLADLVERVEDVVRAWDLCQPTQAVVDAMRTALDSLNGGGA